MLLLFLSLVVGFDISSCFEQHTCLKITVDECDENLRRRFCVKWEAREGCEKSNVPGWGFVVNHVCLGDMEERYLSNGTYPSEYWLDEVPICGYFPGGTSAVFGIKDNLACSGSEYYIIPTTSNQNHIARCDGPVNVCHGEDAEECRWIVDLPICSL